MSARLPRCPNYTPDDRINLAEKTSLAPRTTPEELGIVYPHRWAIPRETWVRFFSSAEREIGILAYSALFLAEDAGLLQILADKGQHDVKIRIALGDPDGPHVAERGIEEGIGDAMPAKVRNALSLFRPLHAVPNIEIRIHRAVLYHSIYCVDDQLLVNQHIYGYPAAHASVIRINKCVTGDMGDTYTEALNRIWGMSSKQG